MFAFFFPLFCPTTKQRCPRSFPYSYPFLYSTLHSTLPQQRATHSTHFYLHLSIFSVLFFSSPSSLFCDYIIHSSSCHSSSPPLAPLFSLIFSLSLYLAIPISPCTLIYLLSFTLSFISTPPGKPTLIANTQPSLTHSHIHTHTYKHSTLALRFT